ncbi:MAG: hypothetical protein Q7S59_05470 [Sulfurimonas sp.]|nr:hypothetical protein [Sulfurimonas sp.]
MLTLKIQNPEIENIFLEGFQSNKEMFFEFVKDSYNKMVLLHSFDNSVKQVKHESEIERLEGIVNKSKTEVIEASNKNDNSKVVELTKNIANCQKNINDKFALFESKQLKYDELSEMYEKKLEALSL